MKTSILVLLAALCVSQASARTWHILNDGSGDAPTVQAGIDSAAVGDTVLGHAELLRHAPGWGYTGGSSVGLRWGRQGILHVIVRLYN